MEEGIIKALADAGLGLGSLMIMAGLFVYQLKTNREIQKDHKEAYNALGSQIKENTDATREMTQTMREYRETDRKMIQAVEYCKTKNQSV
ncbi:MAG: hypothetical protein ACOYUZ_00525 [Patescibacteria group bacterium]